MKPAVSLLAVLAAAISVVAAAEAGASAPAPLRTVLVVPQGHRTAPQSPRVGPRDCIARPRRCVNGVGGVELAFAVSGRLPARPQVGTVLTDTNCQADSYGISHCLNRIRLRHGVLTVRHDHSMMNDPCLAPGQRVRVQALRGR